MVATDPFGGGNLRSFWPSAELARRGWNTHAQIGLPWPSDAYDAVWIHRPLFTSYPDKVQALQRGGAKVIVDEDDALWLIHQTKNEIGLQEWVPRAVQAHDIAISIADGMSVSTPFLAEHYAKYNRHVWVCRNHLPKEYGGLHSYMKDGRFRVGWAGITQTHRHDLEWIAPVFAELIEGALFSTIGDRKTAQLLGYPDEVEYHDFQSEPLALYQLMARASVGIVPLLPNDFNRGKSWLKALEYMTVGVPVVATDLEEQRALITHGEDGFLAKTAKEMASYVQILRRDPVLRQQMADNARKRAADLAIEEQGETWERPLEAMKMQAVA